MNKTDSPFPSVILRRKKWSKWEGVVPSTIRWCCMIWQYIKYMFQLYLCLRQYRVFEERNRIPRALYGRIPRENFDRAREYHKDLLFLEVFSIFYFVVYETWSILYAGYTYIWFLSGPLLEYLDVWPIDWDMETGESIVFICLCILISNCVMIPLDIWKYFVIEERYGFNRMTFMSYLLEVCKVIVFESIWSMVAVAAIIYIVREARKMFFVWIWFFCFFWLMLTIAIYPNFIAPIFNRYTPLREGRLRDRLLRLAHFIGFPIDDILVLHQHWKSEHKNAYFIGLLSSKRIVLYDTLLEGYPDAEDEDEEAPRRIRYRNQLPNTSAADPISVTSIPSVILHSRDSKSRAKLRENRTKSIVSRASMYDNGFTEHEIEAIVARLMGHWVMGHAVTEMIFPLVSLFLFFVIFSFVYENSSLFSAFEVPENIDKPIILGLRLLLCDVMDIYALFVAQVVQCLSRQREYESDSFATKLGYGDDLIDALVELNKENLDYPYFDKWYWYFHYSEPNLLQRITEIEEDMRRMEWKEK